VSVELPWVNTSGLDRLLGVEYTEMTPERACADVTVRDEIKQPAGLVHGGVYAAIAESLASLGTAMGVMPEGNFAMGLSNQTSFLRPVMDGTIHAEAVRKHRGRTTWVWEVEIRDDEQRLCVLSRVTIAVRPA
jgi:uncharacterized protein (TIGR00369 family)